jgi:hypothetical protein
MRLSKQQINEIKNLRKDFSLRKLSKMLNVCINTIRWHTEESFRNQIREYQKNRYQRMNQEAKSEYLNKKREYQKDYHRNRYKNDSEFRKRQIESSKRSKKK